MIGHHYRRRWPKPDIDVEILSPVVTPNPHYPGERDVSWDDPTVRETVKLSGLYPANEEVLDHLGLEAHRALYEIYCDAVDVTPGGRIRIEGRTYSIVNAQEWPNYTRVIAERMQSREEEGS